MMGGGPAEMENSSELEIAIELSRRTFMEEEAKREAEKRDLMVIEDPAVLERQRQIEEIKQMLRGATRDANNPSNPFLPPSMAPSSSSPVFVQPQIMAPQSAYPCSPAAFGATPHFCLPSTSSSSSSPATAQFEFSRPFTPSFPVPPPTPAPLFTNSTQFRSSAHSSLHAPYPSHQQNPLIIQTVNLNPFKKNANLAPSPLKVPFRNGDLIDLNSPRARSMAIEEFDPLYKKMEKLRNSQEEMENVAPGNSQQIERKREEGEKRSSSSESAGSNNRSSGEKPKAKPRRKTRPNRMLTCEDLKAMKELSCDFYKEKQSLSEQSSRLALSMVKGDGGTTTATNVFFLCPVLDYFVTTLNVDTIKLRVHQDDTWPRDTPEEPKKVELACGVGNSSEEILVDVLLRLLSPEEIDQNQGQIPLGEYALKVFGTDEFLVREAPIGKHPFVADCLAKGNDVELEVGKCTLPQTPMPSRMAKRVTSAYPLVNEDVFTTFAQTLRSHVDKCLAHPEEKKHRQPIVQSIKMITTYMYNVQPADLISAIDFLHSANSPAYLHEAINSMIAALIRLFRAYCRSTLTDFSVRNPLEREEDGGETRDAGGCNEKLILTVESVHNVSANLLVKYKAFFIEAHLMYGPKSYGMCASSPRTLASKHNFAYVPIQLWVDFDVHISSLPRECQVCFILRGVPILEEATATNAGQIGLETATGGGSAASSGYGSARNSANNESGIFHHQLASASVPLYSVDGFLLQGPLLVPLRQMEGDVVQPWGPRPLIRDPKDIILAVKALEFDYRIQFPAEIKPSEVHWRQFDSLPADEQENLQSLVENAISHQLADDDREFLWSNRHCLHQFPRALPLVLGSSFSWGTYSLGNIYALLQKWVTLPPVVAMELLLPYFQDRHVREKALESVGRASSEFLFNLITQFVEALRYETFENSRLATFLLEQSTKDRRFAFELFWQLQHRIQQDGKSPSFAARCQLLQQMLLELNIPSFENEIAFQQLFLERLDKISAAVKASAADGMMMKILHKELYKLSDELDMRNVRIPIAPSFRCQSISVVECSIFNSLTKPIKIMLKGKRNSFGIIYKVGDDLRQDAVVVQLVRAMNDIWLGEQLDLRMVLFGCLPTGSRKGLIELIPNCSTLREIHVQSGSGVAGVYKDEMLDIWLRKQNPSEFQYNTAWENFRRSCAGWCVATYVLGIGDRHNDNILVTTNGHVFHIDFGKYMGDWQMAAGFKRDRVPFVFTPDMAFVINRGQTSTEYFQRFVDECCQALNLLRKNCAMVLNIMRFLSCSDIPGMSMDSVNFVENNLMLDLNDIQATVLFTRMIEDTMQSRFPRLNFFAHTLAQFKGNPLQISGVTKVEDMNRLSFSSEIYTEKSDGRIETVLVNSYEKWQENSKKIYMYKLLVKRRNENVNSQIYRTFQEFQELHWKLCFRFSSRAIPPLSQTVNVGRTNIRAVAVRRQWELQYFIQRLYALSDEVAHCDLLYTFLHPLYRDTEPESRKLNGMPDIHADANSQCQLLLRISMDQPNSELRIFVGHAKNLPLVGREQAPDSYVKTYLRWGVSLHQKQWKRKTQVVRNAQNPTYNAEICYSLANLGTFCPSSSLSLPNLSHLSLDVSIWHLGNAVLKDNFPLCETRIQLNQLDDCAPGKKGVKELESWFTLTPSYG